ncbi:MAG: protein translocase subunit SecF [bacterium]|nr:protein translocase subunit SecF [Patescibacteria group bacterium]MDW8279810.1 protein translocase subunit SecF [bacterium]
MINIIGNKKIFLFISGILVVGAIICIILFGLKQGIDFSGGSFLKFYFKDDKPKIEQLENLFIETLNIKDLKITYDFQNNYYFVRMPNLTNDDYQKINNVLKQKFSSYEELSFQSIGPSIGASIKQRAYIAIILVLIGISLYIAFAFRKVYVPVSSWKYGFVTLITLFHDVVIPTGMLALLGKTQGIEIDSNFVVALLVVMGFSVHDTIVVFDRIRENILNLKNKLNFEEIVNYSVNQTLARSINTSLTLVLVLIALYFWGPLTLKYFILTLLVGTIVGTYSSIFVASPLLVIWQKFSSKK